MTARPIEPNFIYAGSPKAGSTWLFEALRDHPQIFVSPEKSTGHWESDAPGPLKDYLDQFTGAGDARAVGEIAHDTFLYEGAAERIAEVLPDIKVLFCLREPGDFARSAMQWWSAHTDMYGETPQEMFAHERMHRLLDYSARLTPFYRAFPRAQIKVVFFDDLRRDPRAFLREILEFLDVEPDYHPDVLDRVSNPAGRARFRTLTHLAFRTGGVLRQFGMGAMVERIKHHPMVEKLLYAPMSADVSTQTKAALEDIRSRSRQDLGELEELLQAPVPQEWKST